MKSWDTETLLKCNESKQNVMFCMSVCGPSPSPSMEILQDFVQQNKISLNFQTIQYDFGFTKAVEFSEKS
jgi:hypothetical protein